MKKNDSGKPGSPVRLVAKGNIDLSNRKPVSMGAGMYATIRSISIPISDANPHGHQVVIPTVHYSGKIMTDKGAIAEYLHTGKHLGIAKNVSDAEKYAQWLHLQEAKRINK